MQIKFWVEQRFLIMLYLNPIIKNHFKHKSTPFYCQLYLINRHFVSGVFKNINFYYGISF